MEREGAEWTVLSGQGKIIGGRNTLHHFKRLRRKTEDGKRGRRVDGAEWTGENYWREEERANTLHHFKRLRRKTEDGKRGRRVDGAEWTGENFIGGGRERTHCITSSARVERLRMETHLRSLFFLLMSLKCVRVPDPCVHTPPPTSTMTVHVSRYPFLLVAGLL
jgi:hypothetical protein